VRAPYPGRGVAPSLLWPAVGLGLLLGAIFAAPRGSHCVEASLPPCDSIRVGWWFGLERVRAAPVEGATLIAADSSVPLSAGDSTLFTLCSDSEGEAILATCGERQTRGQAFRVAGGPLVLSAVVTGSGKVVRQQLPWPVEVRASKGGLLVIAQVPLEDYVAGVVAGEASAASPWALLQALAIGARGYALANLAKHGAQHFDVCTSSHCQNFRPSPPAWAREAVAATRGLVLTTKGQLVPVHYHTACGGTTDSASAIWGGPDILGLSGLTDDDSAKPPILTTDDAVAAFLSEAQGYCRASPYYRWEMTMSKEQLEAALRLGLAAIGSPLSCAGLDDLKVVGRTPGGRATELLIVSEAGAARVTGENIRWVFGGGRIGGSGALPSRLFVIQRSADGATYTFRGGGYGHGVGLCLAGASYLARQGRSAREILSHYYPGADLSPIPSGNQAAAQENETERQGGK